MLRPAASTPEGADPVGPYPPRVDVALGNNEAAQHEHNQQAERAHCVGHDHGPPDGPNQAEEADLKGDRQFFQSMLPASEQP